jgi:polysaccharide deacetylase 2 family uncharacterized protein YibQ
MGLFDRFRKDSVKDPFGGDGDDDFYEDDESRFSGKGPKIALAASGVVFAGVIGFIAYVLLTSPETPVAAPVTGSLADLEVVEDVVPPPGAENTPAVVPDATAATDRSAERRPWLAAQPAAPAEGPRLGVDAKTKPAPTPAKPAPPAAAKPAIAPPTTTAAVTPPATAAPAAAKPVAPTPPAAAAKPAAPPPTAAKEAQVAVLPTPKTSPTGLKPVAPAAPAPATPASPPEAAKPEPTPAEEPTEDVPSIIAGIPSLNAAGVAPGAPERIVTTGDAGPSIAGGRPRLVEPPLPPTDRVAVSAPPPRYAALRDVKKETAPPPTNAAKIAIVVRGLGLGQAATEAAITKLPAGVTLAFSPYARNLKSWVDRAKAAGHEVLIEVPLESKEFPAQDPGPLGLLTTLELKDNTERLDAIIKASAGATGVFDAMGTKFRESDPHLTPMFAKLKEQNLFYVQGSPGIRVGESTVPHAAADVVLDERPFRAAIDARLDYVERLARYQGTAIASLNAKPVSFERLVLWLDQATKKGVALAPISSVLIRVDAPAAPATPAAAGAAGAAGTAATPTAAGAKPAAAGAKPAAPGAKAKPEPQAPSTAKAKAKT